MVSRVSAVGLASVVLGVLAFGAADAAAQPPAHSFAELSPSLKVGEYVYVTDEQGILRMGTVASLTGAQLEIDGIQQPRSRIAKLFFVPVGSPVRRYILPEKSVRRIQKDDSTWNGRLIGGAVGALLLGWSCSGASHSEGCPGAGGAAVIGAVLGVWLGDRIDDLIPTSIYVSPRRAPVSIAPVLIPTQVGVTATVHF